MSQSYYTATKYKYTSSRKLNLTGKNYRLFATSKKSKGTQFRLKFPLKSHNRDIQITKIPLLRKFHCTYWILHVLCVYRYVSAYSHILHFAIAKISRLLSFSLPVPVINLWDPVALCKKFSKAWCNSREIEIVEQKAKQDNIELQTAYYVL